MENYLDKCLTSLIILDNSIMNLVEILIINDGSKDNSLFIAQKYAKLYKNIIVIDKDNGNYGSCINYGLKIAKGKYIKILDADDYFDNYNFIEFINYLNTCDDDLILSDCDIVNNNDIIIGAFNVDKKISRETSHPFKMILTNKVAEMIQMHNVTYKTDNLRLLQYKQTEGISYTDIEWVFTPMTTINSFSIFNKTIYKYLIGRTGQTISNNTLKKNLKDITILTLSLLDKYHNIKYSKNHQSYLKRRLQANLENIYCNQLINNTFNRIDFLSFDLKIKSKYEQYYNEMSQWTISTSTYKYILHLRLGNKYFLKNLLKGNINQTFNDFIFACDIGTFKPLLVSKIVNKIHSMKLYK